MIIPAYKYIARKIPVICCCTCGRSSHDGPVYAPFFMGQNPEDKAAPIPGREYCHRCWEKAFDKEPMVTKLVVTIDAHGSRNSKSFRVDTYDEKQRLTEDGFVIEGHPCPPAAGSIVPPKISSKRLSEDLVSLATDFLRRGGVEDPWMLDADINHPRTSKIAAYLSQEVKDSIMVLLSGKVPKSGFVLGGTSNSGKTGAIAAWTCAWAINHLRRFGPFRGESHVEQPRARYQNRAFAWLNWLHAYREWRRACDEQGGLEALDLLWKPLAKIPLLIIDDLGAETPNPHYGIKKVEDALACLIDIRSGNNLPTIVTTNLNEKDLREHLEETRANRLLDNNPFVALPGSWNKLSRKRA